MAKKDIKDNLRLTIISLFMFVQMPGQFRYFFSNRKNDVIEDPKKIGILFLTAMMIFMMLEILEYLKWNYRYRSRRIPLLLFFFRVSVFSCLVLFSRLGMGHPEIAYYVTLILFYGYYAFPFSVSSSMALIIVIAYIIYEVSGLKHHGEAVQNVFYSTYKVLVMVMFYFFAYFWEKDRTISDENIKLVEDLNRSEQNLREFAQKVGQVVALEERNRLARDIHDSVGHALSAIQIQLSKSEAYFSIDPEESLSGIKEARQSANDVMQDIRSSLGILKNPGMSINLQEDLPRILKMAESESCRVEFNSRGDEKGCNYAVILTVYRMVQEGVTNILKYAEASFVSLNIDFGEDEILVDLADNGCGFIPDNNRNSGVEHYGLEGLSRRLELVRGRLEIHSVPGMGCRLTARIPRDPVSLIGGQDE